MRQRVSVVFVTHLLRAVALVVGSHLRSDGVNQWMPATAAVFVSALLLPRSRGLRVYKAGLLVAAVLELLASIWAFWAWWFPLPFRSPSGDVLVAATTLGVVSFVIYVAGCFAQTGRQGMALVAAVPAISFVLTATLLSVRHHRVSNEAILIAIGIGYLSLGGLVAALPKELTPRSE